MGIYPLRRALKKRITASEAVDLEWPDMDLFIAIHSAKTLFVGDLPKTIKDSKKRYDIMMGVVVEKFAKNKKHRGSGKLVHSEDGPRDWQTESPIGPHHQTVIFTRRGSLAWNVHNIEAILNEANQ